MVIFDDVFSWQGWGGKFNLASGRCRLRIFDLSDRGPEKLSFLKPIVVVVSDIPYDGPSLKRVTVKSCASHIATQVVERFKLDPQRTLFVEYYPQTRYGTAKEHVIAERYELVDFVWHDAKALHPSWKQPPPHLLETLQDLMARVPAHLPAEK